MEWLTSTLICKGHGMRTTREPFSKSSLSQILRKLLHRSPSLLEMGQGSSAPHPASATSVDDEPSSVTPRTLESSAPHLHRIAFCMTAGSAAFSTQSDHVNALQWAYLLLQQGVPPMNIRIWLPTRDGDTVVHPRPSVLGPPRVDPPGVSLCRDVTGTTFRCFTELFREFQC
jgi:hypothetical protein